MTYTTKRGAADWVKEITSINRKNEHVAEARTQ